MQIDWYTKAVLSVIAFLTALAVGHYLASPSVTAQAQNGLSNVTFAGPSGGLWFFDKGTGEIWSYTPSGEIKGHWKLAALGKPLEVKCGYSTTCGQ
jgi:hypothetical protein